MWEQVLRPGLLGAGETIEILGATLCIYLVTTDSTCGDVERGLGALARVVKQHTGKWDEEGATISFCIEVLQDGPISEEGLGCRPGGRALVPASGKRCPARAREVVGRHAWAKVSCERHFKG